MTIPSGAFNIATLIALYLAFRWVRRHPSLPKAPGVANPGSSLRGTHVQERPPQTRRFFVEVAVLTHPTPARGWGLREVFRHLVSKQKGEDHTDADDQGGHTHVLECGRDGEL